MATPRPWARALPVIFAVAVSCLLLGPGASSFSGRVPGLAVSSEPRGPGGTVGRADLGGARIAAPPARTRAAAPPSEARPASIVDPLSDYSKEPAPMGIADFGVTGTGSGAHAYTYAAPAFEGSAVVRSMDVAIPYHGTTLTDTAFELNAVVDLRLNGTNYSYWIQNGLHLNASSDEFTIGGAYVWNFSAPDARLAGSELRGNSSSVLASDTYYFIPGCSTFPGQCAPVALPAELTARVLSATSDGTPYVAYQYDLGNGWVTYDNVSFLHMVGATDLGFVVDGFSSTPIASGLFYDAEWVWVAAGGGLSSKVRSADINLSLSYWNGHNYQEVPTAWDFGSNTGESSSNVTETAATAGAGGAVAAHLVNGSGTLGPLYNGSEVGFLNVSVPPTGAQTLEVDGAPTSFEVGLANLTLAAGSYIVALENYSNASVRVDVAPGATTYVDLDGAGRTAFEAVGLPAGTRWGLELDGQWENSSAREIALDLPNGTYSVGYTAVPGYLLNASTPTEVAVPTASPVRVDFHAFTFEVPFTETGLPASTPWWVNASGLVVRGASATLDVFAPNGSTPFEVGASYAYVPSPANGTLVVVGGQFSAPSIQFAERLGYIAGTVSPTGASVTIGGVAQPIVAGAFNDSVVPGSYTLVASATGYNTTTLRVTVTPGNVTSERISLNRTPSSVVVATPVTSGSAFPTDAILIVAVVAIAAIGLVLGFLLRRRGA